MWCWDGHKGLRFDRGISIGAYFLIYTSKIKPVQGELPWNQFFCSELTGVRFMRAKLTKIFYIGNLLYPCSPKGEGDILFLYPRSPRGKGVYCFTSVRPSKIFFVAFFSVTVDGRNLIFGHKHHIGIPYCG